MSKKVPTMLALLALALFVTACNKEVKPSKKGVFIISGEKLIECAAVFVEADSTPEGFALNYFTSEPKAKVTPGAFHIILYGDYKPFSLRAFTVRNGRFEEDTSRGNMTDLLKVGGINGEKEMVRCRFTKELQPGTYVLDVEQGTTTLRFPFQVTAAS